MDFCGSKKFDATEVWVDRALFLALASAEAILALVKVSSSGVGAG